MVEDRGRGHFFKSLTERENTYMRLVKESREGGLKVDLSGKTPFKHLLFLVRMLWLFPTFVRLKDAIFQS
jgi:hypothetical protein